VFIILLVRGGIIGNIGDTSIHRFTLVHIVVHKSVATDCIIINVSSEKIV